MVPFSNPALKALLQQQQPNEPLVFVQLLMRRQPEGMELRHVADQHRSQGELIEKQGTELRDLAQTTETGAFRPLKTAPSLIRGWRAVCRSEGDLERALEDLYPGALADWYAGLNQDRETAGAVTFQQFVGRQTGMYRVAQKLTDSQIAPLVRAGCHARFCLRHRRWTFGPLDTEQEIGKSEVPCWEPCAILLELARRTARLEQEEKQSVCWSSGEWATLRAALERALDHPDLSLREGDSSAPANPRRIQMLLEKLPALPAGKRAEQSGH